MHLTALKREEVAQLASPSVLSALLCTLVDSTRVHDDKRQSMLADWLACLHTAVACRCYAVQMFELRPIGYRADLSNPLRWIYIHVLLLMSGQEEKRALDARKVLHIRELKRVAHEDRSKFSKRPTLSGRCEPSLQLVSWEEPPPSSALAANYR